MSDESEDDHYASLADRVERETAKLLRKIESALVHADEKPYVIGMWAMETDPGDRDEGSRDAASPLTDWDCNPNKGKISVEEISLSTRNSVLITDGGDDKNDGEIQDICRECDVDALKVVE